MEVAPVCVRGHGARFVAIAAAALLLPGLAASEVVARDGSGKPDALVAISASDIDSVWPRLDSVHRLAVIEQLIGAAEFATVERLLASSEFPAGIERKTARFYLGMLRKGQGRPDEAIAIFRELLAGDPGFARVRLELAHTLYAVQDDEAARHNFQLVLGGTASNPAVADIARSYIGSIDSRKRFDATAYVTIAPSTNLNQGAEHGSVVLFDANGNPLDFTLDGRNVKQSGVGLVGGVQASYRQPVTDRLDVILSGGANARQYREPDFNSAQVNATFGPRYRFEWGYLGLYGLLDHNWSADEAQYYSWGGLISGNVRLGDRDIVFADATCQNRDFSAQWQGTDLRYKDGHVCSLSMRYDHHFASASFVRALSSYGQERTGLSHLENDYWLVGGGLSSELPWGISLYVQGTYTDRDFEGVYPTLATARSDRRWDVSINVTKRDWIIAGFAPQVQYTYTLNDSNVSFFQYDAHGVNFTLTRKF